MIYLFTAWLIGMLFVMVWIGRQIRQQGWPKLKEWPAVLFIIFGWPAAILWFTLVMTIVYWQRAGY